MISREAGGLSKKNFPQSGIIPIFTQTASRVRSKLRTYRTGIDWGTKAIKIVTAHKAYASVSDSFFLPQSTEKIHPRKTRIKTRFFSKDWIQEKIRNFRAAGIHVISDYAVSLDEKDHAEFLKEIVQRKSFAPFNTALSVDGPFTLLRTVDLPVMTKNALRESFKYELTKYIPFSADEVYYDFSVLPSSKGPTMKVLLAVVKKDFLDEKLNILSRAGIYPRTITLAPVVLNNLFAKVYETEKDTIALIDMGFSSWVINVISSGTLLLSREIKKASDDIFRIFSVRIGSEIKNFADLSLCEKISPELILETIPEAVEGIRLSLDYLETRENIAIRKILLSGGFSMCKNFASAFAAALGIEVSALRILDKLPCEEQTRAQLDPHEGDYMIAMGLAV